MLETFQERIPRVFHGSPFRVLLMFGSFLPSNGMLIFGKWRISAA
jgi:hypothetical protein